MISNMKYKGNGHITPNGVNFYYNSFSTNISLLTEWIFITIHFLQTYHFRHGGTSPGVNH